MLKFQIKREATGYSVSIGRELYTTVVITPVRYTLFHTLSYNLSMFRKGSNWFIYKKRNVIGAISPNKKILPSFYTFQLNNYFLELYDFFYTVVIKRYATTIGEARLYDNVWECQIEHPDFLEAMIIAVIKSEYKYNMHKYYPNKHFIFGDAYKDIEDIYDQLFWV